MLFPFLFKSVHLLRLFKLENERIKKIVINLCHFNREIGFRII